MYTRRVADFDAWLSLSVVALMGFGLLMIGSATRISFFGSSAAFDSQLVFIVLGIIIFLAAVFIDYRFIASFYLPIYLVCIGLLVFVLLFEPEVAGVQRWIRFNLGGVTFGLQPSEFAKVFMIIFLAKFLDNQGENINRIKMLGVLAGLVLLPVVLIILQPSLSAGVIVFVISLGVLFVGNVGGRNVLVATCIAAPIAMLLIYDFGREERIFLHLIVEEYQLTRIETLVNPEAATADETFQIERSLQAIGAGQLRGQGLHQGHITQTAGLPAAETDFIMSVVGEELGFIGVMGVLVVMLFVVGRTFYAALRAPDLLGRLICIGVTVKLAFQTFANVGVVTEILPNTGVPFPFISYGGSSLWTSLVAVGLVINVRMTRAKSIFKEVAI